MGAGDRSGGTDPHASLVQSRNVGGDVMLDVEVSPIISYTEGGKELDDGLNKLEEQKRVRERNGKRN